MASLFALLGLIVVMVAIAAPPSRIIRDSVGTWGLPALTGIVLMVGGAIQVYRALWVARGRVWELSREGEEDEPEHSVSSLRPIVFAGGVAAYLVLLTPLGYLVATPLFMAAGMWAMAIRNPWLLVLSTVGFTMVSFLVFSSYLNVPIPVGILRDPLVELGIIPRVR